MLLLYLTPVRGAGITQTTYLWNFHVGIWMNSRELLTGELRRTPLPRTRVNRPASCQSSHAPQNMTVTTPTTRLRSEGSLVGGFSLVPPLHAVDHLLRLGR